MISAMMRTNESLDQETRPRIRLTREATISVINDFYANHGSRKPRGYFRFRLCFPLVVDENFEYFQMIEKKFTLSTCTCFENIDFIQYRCGYNNYTIPNCYCTSDHKYILRSSINILSFTIIISLIVYFNDLFIYA